MSIKGSIHAGFIELIRIKHAVIDIIGASFGTGIRYADINQIRAQVLIGVIGAITQGGKQIVICVAVRAKGRLDIVAGKIGKVGATAPFDFYRANRREFWGGVACCLV